MPFLPFPSLTRLSRHLQIVPIMRDSKAVTATSTLQHGNDWLSAEPRDAPSANKPVFYK